MVAGQPEAIDAVADVVMVLQRGWAIRASRSQPAVRGAHRVGKTETAKALARYLFGSADRLVRFDMSELASPDSVSRWSARPGGSRASWRWPCGRSPSA
jgi:ATP-dependent Clp protease ATP-binding subunit ClpA